MKKQLSSYRLLAFLMMCVFSFQSCLLYKKTPYENIEYEKLRYIDRRTDFYLVTDLNGNQFKLSNIELTKDGVIGSVSFDDFNIGDLTKHDKKKRFLYNTKKNYSPKLFGCFNYNQAILKNADSLSIPFEAISNYHLHDYSKLNSFVMAISSVATVVGGGALILLAACNCPFAQVVGEDETIDVGNLFPGSLAKPLERKDLLILNDFPKNAEGKFEFQVENRLPEVEYINSIKHYFIAKKRFQNLGVLNEVDLVKYNPGQQPILAQNSFNEDFKLLIDAKDEQTFDFNAVQNVEEFNSLELDFVVKPNTSNLLALNLKKTKWTDKMAEVFFYKLGDKFDKWQEGRNKTTVKKFEKSTKERGIALNVYAMKNDKWKYVESINYVGSSNYRDVLLSIPEEFNNDGKVQVKLETAYNFWSVDQVQMIDDFELTKDKQAMKLESISSNTEFEQADIENADDTYVVLANEGDKINMKYEYPASNYGWIVVESQGYYEHQRDYTHEPDKQYFKAMRKSPITTHISSILLEEQFTQIEKEK